MKDNTMQASPENRRQNKRISIHIPAVIRFKDKANQCFRAEVMDISVGGAFIHCTAPLMIGDEILLEIRFTEVEPVEPHADWIRDNGPETSPEIAVIRWVRGSSTSGFGVEFVTLKPGKKQFLSQLAAF